MRARSRLAALVTLALGVAACAFPAFAADRKPLVLGSTGNQQQIQSTDTLKLPAATTANASINLPHGTAPSSPNNGDCWTTTAGLYCRINGATVGPMGTGATGANPTATASDTAVNGSASTYMRSDAAPAVQKATTGQFGVVKPDGSTITVTGGVISASGGGLTNPDCFSSGPCLRLDASSPGGADPAGTLGITTSPVAFSQKLTASTTMTVVQQTSGQGNSATFSGAPTIGNTLVAMCGSWPEAGHSDPATVASGWTLIDAATSSTWAPARTWAYRVAGSGESTTQTPCSGGAVAIIYEVSGVGAWASAYVGITDARDTGGSATSVTVNLTTSNANQMVLGGWVSRGNISAAGSVSGLTGTLTTTACSGGGCENGAGRSQSFSSNGTSVSATGSWSSSPGGITGSLLSLKPLTDTWANFFAPTAAVYTVATLPAAAAAGAGARAFVTDATGCTFGSSVTGGGSTKCPVYSDGSAWKVG
jgi:hypothetical protein